ncbi:MAG: hypothetical protein ACTTH3_01740 [Schwartzia sp. (in: firmicutes)]
MDVTALAKTAVGMNDYAKALETAKRTGVRLAAEGEAKAEKASGAYDVQLSAAGRKAQKGEDVAQGKEKTKGLSADQVQALQAQQDQSYQLMIETMTAQNAKLQAWQDKGVGTLRFANGAQVEAWKFALPPVATTPEDAAKAVADGGDWSVDAVASRIFDMATAIAGDDPETLRQMQAAVEKGFQQAGVAFKKATGEKEMPAITGKTHEELTRRFDERYKTLAEKSVAQAVDTAKREPAAEE